MNYSKQVDQILTDLQKEKDPKTDIQDQVKQILKDLNLDILDDNNRIRWPHIVLNLGKIIAKIIYVIILNKLNDGQIKVD